MSSVEVALQRLGDTMKKELERRIDELERKLFGPLSGVDWGELYDQVAEMFHRTHGGYDGEGEDKTELDRDSDEFRAKAAAYFGHTKEEYVAVMTERAKNQC